MALPEGMTALKGFLDLPVYAGAFQDPLNGIVVLEPFASYYTANGGAKEFGHPKSGLYGTMGSVEQDFEYAHFQADGTKVVVQLKDRTNINNFSVGPGVLALAKNNKLEVTGDEVYYKSNKAGVGQLSVTPARDRDGLVYQIEAVEFLSAANTTLRWEVSLYRKTASL